MHCLLQECNAGATRAGNLRAAILRQATGTRQHLGHVLAADGKWDKITQLLAQLGGPRNRPWKQNFLTLLDINQMSVAGLLAATAGEEQTRSFLNTASPGIDMHVVLASDGGGIDPATGANQSPLNLARRQ